MGEIFHKYHYGKLQSFPWFLRPILGRKIIFGSKLGRNFPVFVPKNDLTCPSFDFPIFGLFWIKFGEIWVKFWNSNPKFIILGKIFKPDLDRRICPLPGPIPGWVNRLGSRTFQNIFPINTFFDRLRFWKLKFCLFAQGSWSFSSWIGWLNFSWLFSGLSES